MWSNCTLPHCDWTFLDREEEVKSQECGKWQFSSLAIKLAATGNARLTVRHIQFTIPLTSTLYNELDWSQADLLVTYFHNLTWQFWELIFHSVWMFKTTKPPTMLLYKTICLPTGYPPKQGSRTEPVTVVVSDDHIVINTLDWQQLMRRSVRYSQKICRAGAKVMSVVGESWQIHVATSD